MEFTQVKPSRRCMPDVSLDSHKSLDYGDRVSRAPKALGHILTVAISLAARQITPLKQENLPRKKEKQYDSG